MDAKEALAVDLGQMADRLDAQAARLRKSSGIYTDADREANARRLAESRKQLDESLKRMNRLLR